MTAAKTTKAATGTTAPTAAMEETIAATKESMDAAVKAGQESMTKSVEQAMSASKEQFDKASASLYKGMDEMADYSKANTDAVITSANVVTKGVEAMARSWFAFTQTSVDQSMAVAKKAMAVKSLKELADLQSAYTKDSFDALLTEGTKMSELALKTANDALAPLSARVNDTVSKIGKTAA